MVFFWRDQGSKKRDSQSKWVGPGYIVGLQDRNAWVACGGRCFLVAGEHLREAIGDEKHFGDPELQKSIALFKKIPKEATYEDLVGQRGPQDEPLLLETERLAKDISEDVDMSDDEVRGLPEEYSSLRNKIGWHVDSAGHPVLVSHKVWAFRTPESRYAPERLP